MAIPLHITRHFTFHSITEVSAVIVESTAVAVAEAEIYHRLNLQESIFRCLH